MTDSVQTVEDTCRQVLYEGATDTSSAGLGLAEGHAGIRGLGWRHVAPDALGGNPGDVLLENVLEQAILRLNPALASTPDRAQAVISELRTIIASARADGIAAARARMLPWILGQRALPGRLYIRLVDLGDVEQNSFIAIEHRKVTPGDAAGTPAFVLYVNGIPFVVLETETPSAGDAEAPPAEVAPAAEVPAVPASRVPGDEPPPAPAEEPPAAAVEVPADVASAGPQGDFGDTSLPDWAAPLPDEGEPAAAAPATEAPADEGEPAAAAPAAEAPADEGEPAAAAPAAEAPATEPPATGATPAAPPAPRKGTWQMAASRIVTLEGQVPELFASNVVTAATDGREFRHAAAGVAPDEWSSAAGGSADALRTVLRPDALLDQLTLLAFGGDE